MNDTKPEVMTPATLVKPNEIIRMGMDTVQGFEALQRAANLLSSSTIVPEPYRRWVMEKDRSGNLTRVENPSGLANCVVCLNMAARMDADPILIAQNLHVIEGRPSWSSQFVIASINQCGRFSPLRFEISPVVDEVEVSYQFDEWSGPKGSRTKETKTGKLKIRPRTCRAWAIEKATGERLEGPEVSMQMAIDEGWIQRNGSKWRTMPEVMLRYRAASFFGKLYAPELLMGLQSREELEDIVPISGEVFDADTGEPVKVHTRAKVISEPEQRGSKMLAETEWTLEQLEEWEDLMGRAYKAFKDAGQVEMHPMWAEKWKPKRGVGDALGTLRDLAEDVKSFEAAAESVKTEQQKPE